MKPRAAISWSGGKDCCTSLLRAHHDYDIAAMVTMFAEDGERSRSHGLRPDIIAAHAQRLGVASLTGRCSWSSYTDEYTRVLRSAAALGITHVIFGDIMGDAHRAWDERVCAVHGLTPVLPIWGESTRTLVEEFIASRSTAVIVTARAAHLDELALTNDHARCRARAEVRVIRAASRRIPHAHRHATLQCAVGPRARARELHSECWALDVTLSSRGGAAFRGPSIMLRAETFRSPTARTPPSP